MVGLAVFTAASLACALATGDAFLIGSRAVQGVGAAIMLPAALSIVMNMFEEGAERNKALGIWGGLGAAGATVGLIAGGVADPVRRLAVHLLSERPDRGGRAGARAADRPREPARHARAGGSTWPARSAGTGGLVLLVDAISQAPQYGWGASQDDRAARGVGGAARRLPGDREPGRVADAAAVDLPAAHARRRERRRAAARRRASSRSSSSARCTCSRCCTTARSRPASRGWPRR